MKNEINHLTVLPGPACNLACSYCYLRDSRPEKTDPEAVLHGISAFIRYIRERNSNSADYGKITFLGGEPLLHGRNLKKWIIAARSLSPEMPLRVFTNGTLLDNDWFVFFRHENVSITVSLDGRKENNDRFRHFRKNTIDNNTAGSSCSVEPHKHDCRCPVKFSSYPDSESVYDSVLAAVPVAERGNISVCAVVRPENAYYLKENILHIAALGFASAGWAPDMSCFWPDSSIEALSASAVQLKNYYISEIKHGRVPFVIANMYETLSAVEGGIEPCGCGSITLDASGDFYPCDKLMALPVEERVSYKLTGLMQKGNNEISTVSGEDSCRTGSEYGGAVLNYGLEVCRQKFFESLARRGGKFHCNACLAGTLARLDGLNMPAEEKQRIFKSQEKLSAVVRSSLCSMAEEGLKLPLFRMVHGYE